MNRLMIYKMIWVGCMRNESGRLEILIEKVVIWKWVWKVLLIFVFKYVVKNGLLSGSVMLKMSGFLILSRLDGSLFLIVFFNEVFFVFIKMVKVVFIWFVFFIVRIGRSGLFLIDWINFKCMGVKFWCSLVMIRGRKVVFNINFDIVFLIFNSDNKFDVIRLEIKLFIGIKMIYVISLVMSKDNVGVMIMLMDWWMYFLINCLV